MTLCLTMPQHCVAALHCLALHGGPVQHYCKVSSAQASRWRKHAMLHGTGFIQTVWPLERNRCSGRYQSRPTIDVYVPTYEDLSIVRYVLAAMAMDWPRHKLQVYILDDGRRQEFRDFAEVAAPDTSFDRQRARQGGQPEPRNAHRRRAHRRIRLRSGPRAPSFNSRSAGWCEIARWRSSNATPFLLARSVSAKRRLD
jgi:hypothetical protein